MITNELFGKSGMSSWFRSTMTSNGVLIVVDSHLSVASSSAALVAERWVSLWIWWLSIEVTVYPWDGPSTVTGP